MKTTNIITVFIIAFIYCSCSTDPTKILDGKTMNIKNLIVEKPFKNIEKLFQDFIYQGEAVDFNLLGGSVIKFPENAFTEEGEITIKIREFFTPGEILSSGIPMKYDSAGVTSNFQSAGMIEVRMLQNGRELTLKENKEALITMTSHKKATNYNLYQLDEKDGNWDFNCRQKVIKKPKDRYRIEKLQNEIDQLSPPTKPLVKLEKRKIFDLNYKFENHTELKELSNLLWQYSGDNPEKDITNNNKLLQKKWLKVAIYPTKTEFVYFLKLTDKDTIFQTTIRPVLRGELLTKSNDEYAAKLSNFNSEIKDRILEKNRLERENKFLRSFALKGSGIYNYDRQFKEGNTLPLIAEFKFDIPVNFNKSDIKIFLITGDNDVVIKYPKENWIDFRFNPNYNNKLIAILPGNKIAQFGTKDFNKIKVSSLDENKAKPYTFTLKVENKVIKKVEQLDEVIASI